LQSLFLWIRQTFTQVSQSINNDLGLHYQSQKYASFSTMTMTPPTTTRTSPLLLLPKINKKRVIKLPLFNWFSADFHTDFTSTRKK